MVAALDERLDSEVERGTALGVAGGILQALDHGRIGGQQALDHPMADGHAGQLGEMVEVELHAVVAHTLDDLGIAPVEALVAGHQDRREWRRQEHNLVDKGLGHVPAFDPGGPARQRLVETVTPTRQEVGWIPGVLGDAQEVDLLDAEAAGERIVGLGPVAVLVEAPAERRAVGVMLARIADGAVPAGAAVAAALKGAQIAVVGALLGGQDPDLAGLADAVVRAAVPVAPDLAALPAADALGDAQFASRIAGERVVAAAVVEVAV